MEKEGGGSENVEEIRGRREWKPAIERKRANRVGRQRKCICVREREQRRE